MSALAFLTGALTVGIPAAIVFGVTGYLNDQRKGQRRDDPSRSGGRRREDG